MGSASRWASKNIRVSISSSGICVSSLPQFDRDMDGVAVRFSQTLTNRFQDTDHVADAAVCVFETHIHDAPVIRDPVKSRMDLHTPLMTGNRKSTRLNSSH